MDEKIKKSLEDILKAISEIEIALSERSKNYNVFLQDFVFRKFRFRPPVKLLILGIISYIPTIRCFQIYFGQ